MNFFDQIGLINVDDVKRLFLILVKLLTGITSVNSLFDEKYDPLRFAHTVD